MLKQASRVDRGDRRGRVDYRHTAILNIALRPNDQAERDGIVQ